MTHIDFVEELETLISKAQKTIEGLAKSRAHSSIEDSQRLTDKADAIEEAGYVLEEMIQVHGNQDVLQHFHEQIVSLKNKSTGGTIAGYELVLDYIKIHSKNTK